MQKKASGAERSATEAFPPRKLTRTYLLNALGTPKSLKEPPFRQSQTIYEMGSSKFRIDQRNVKAPEARSTVAQPGRAGTRRGEFAARIAGVISSPISSHSMRSANLRTCRNSTASRPASRVETLIFSDQRLVPHLRCFAFYCRTPSAAALGYSLPRLRRCLATMLLKSPANSSPSWRFLQRFSSALA